MAVKCLKINCGYHDRVANLIDHYQAWSASHAWHGKSHQALLSNAPDGIPLYQWHDSDAISQDPSPIIAIDFCKEEPSQLLTNASRWPSHKTYVIFTGFCHSADQDIFPDKRCVMLYWPDPLIDLMKVNLNLSQPFFYQHKRYDFVYPKPSLFTHVSAAVRGHRQKILEILSDKLPKQSFVFRYAGVDHGIDVCQQDLVKKPLSIDEASSFLAQFPIKTDHPHRIAARAMSMDTYNLSYFSLNLETTDLDRFVFVTEKTGRSLLSGQPFVVYSSPGYLQHVRSMGFMTYHTVWDESYDELSQNHQRLTAVADLVIKLAGFDWQANLRALQDIAAHNRQNFFDWHRWIGGLFEDMDNTIHARLAAAQG